VASLHAILLEGTNFMQVSDQMKIVLHKYGIHSTTIQPEYMSEQELSFHLSDSEPVSPAPPSDLASTSLLVPATVMSQRRLSRRELCYEPVCAEDCAQSACCSNTAAHCH